MLRRILAAAVLAGAVAGLFLTALQAVTVTPLILDAETYEQAAAAAKAYDTVVQAVPEAAESAAWTPANGVERTAYTLLTNLLTGIGFALLLAACFAIAGGADWRRGMAWGIAGFAVFYLAPALGLAPEPPGMTAAPLFERQIWWLATVTASAAGGTLLAFAPGWVWKAAGIALLVAPHVVGAPIAPAHEAAIPAALAARFAAASLATTGIFWAVLGGLTGFFYERQGRA